MNQIVYLIKMIFFTLIQVILNPIFLVVLLILFIQYNKISKMERDILGINKESIAKRIFSSTAVGLLGGVLGSIIVILLGVTIEASDFRYIFVLAIILMLIHPRFICFSYGGGLISLFSLIFGFPDINVSSIMAIVAVLHLVESFLIFIDGDTTKIPIFMETKGRIVGGFNMMRFWPIPFIVLLLVSSYDISSGIDMPEWWPLFSSTDMKNIFYIMIGVIAALGYGDMAIAQMPREKIKNSSKNLFLFSIVLLILAVISSHIYVFKYIAAIFSPVAHELLIQIGRKTELNGKSIFSPPQKGVLILDTIPGFAGDRMGLKTGDIIFAINGNRVDYKEEIDNVLMETPSYIWIDLYEGPNNIKTLDYKDYGIGIRKLGILTVPKNSIYPFVVREKDGILKRIMKRK